jgi:hypothetical protein
MKQTDIEIQNALRIAKNPMRYERQFFADGDNKIIDETSCADDSKNAHFANDAVKTKPDNISIRSGERGTGKAYTLSRLQDQQSGDGEDGNRRAAKRQICRFRLFRNLAPLRNARDAFWSRIYAGTER